MSEEEINRYLESAPPGVSETQWENAKKYNPDTNKLVPVPLLGFKQLEKQHTHQRALSDQQLAGVSNIKGKIDRLISESTERQQKIVKYRENAVQLRVEISFLTHFLALDARFKNFFSGFVSGLGPNSTLSFLRETHSQTDLQARTSSSGRGARA